MFRSMWFAPHDPRAMVEQTVAAELFDGVEGPIPEAAAGRRELGRLLDDHGLGFIAECATGLARGGEPPSPDWWVPLPEKTVDDHLDDLKRCVEHCGEMGARFITTMSGYDAWPWMRNVEFYGKVMDLQRSSGVTIAVENHRCRSTYNPWVMRDLLRAFPEMRMTCDFSHWCVVAERVIDTEVEIIELCASRAEHCQCRVGDAQRAQVADPRAPECERAVRSHESWWDRIWDAHAASGRAATTMTPEWGHQGYTPRLPYTAQPVVDLWEVTTSFGRRQRARYAARGGGASGGAAAAM